MTAFDGIDNDVIAAGVLSQFKVGQIIRVQRLANWYGRLVIIGRFRPFARFPSSWLWLR